MSTGAFKQKSGVGTGREPKTMRVGNRAGVQPGQRGKDGRWGVSELEQSLGSNLTSVEVEGRQKIDKPN